jgi:hypothetical protein
MEIAKHKALMQAEINTALDTLVNLGETSDPKSVNEVIDENREWSELLDRHYEEVADFARNHGYSAD